ncbi:cystathionine beta-lyase [Kaustia mangrovi]|uniref:Cystathionine beta-lyase n=1 Tax=Kaustia mangrovi TaxID=2593653 RepID=A0A7S8HAR9_9HYPH|nr:cystathionine beta-lyase [Kaustia mangrovi]QPC41729.1 cystathionine beta-lyase [Kaustia mangrovi]
MVKEKPSTLAPETRLVTAGHDYAEHGFVNPAVYHASTVRYRDVETLMSGAQPYKYGRRGTPTSRALDTAIADLEGGHDARLAPSGLSAITTALLGLVRAGDHILVTDAVYRPARAFCDTMLARLGVETTYYDPRIGAAELAGLIRPNTRLLYTESPGSQTMEVQDLPALADVAHRHGLSVLIDNTWATGRFFRAFEHGADVVVTAATKYIVGHSDAMLGAIVGTAEIWPQLEEAHLTLGECAGPDDAYLGLRGLRTLDVRLERHMRNALEIADWLKSRPEVEDVLHPALPGATGHNLWARDFTGASGLFSVVLKPAPREAVAAMLDGLSLFGMGFSWGGYESLVIPFNPSGYRTATTWTHKGPALRFHIGLEHTDDLKADLDEGFKRLAATAG